MRDRLDSDRCSKYLKALADPERLKILQCLQPGPKAVGDLAKEVGSAIANVSHHLKQLKIAGLVCVKKRGRYMIYELAPDVARNAGGASLNVLEFGCCRVELGRK